MNEVYTENININLRKVENVEKLFLIGRSKRTLHLHEHSILQRY